MKGWLKDNWLLAVAMIAIAIGVWVLRNACFFWDSIALISVPANYLYDNGLMNLLIPIEGHLGVTTLPQWYTALVWRICGRSLVITHLAYLPIVLWMVCEVWRLCKWAVPKFHKGAFLLVMGDATLLAQCMGLTPDLFLVTFALWGVNCALRGERLKGMFALLLVAMVSDRGMLIAAALIIWWGWKEVKSNGGRDALKMCWWVELPTLIYIVLVIVLQRFVAGYWLIDRGDGSPWGEYWQWADAIGWLRNVGITGLRMLENGRWSLWIALVVMAIFGRERVKWNRELMVLGGCLVGVLLVATLPFCNPIGSRYYMLVNVLVTIIVADVAAQLMEKWRRVALGASVLVCLVGSNFLPRPEGLAVAWDSTLAHLPYYELRRELAAEIDARGVDYRKVGVPFPMTNKLNYTYLNGEERRYSSIDLEDNELVVYTNIGNLDDATIETMKRLPLVWRKERGEVFMELRERRPD